MQMHGAQFHTSIRVVSYVVLLLLAAAIGWGAYITLKHWTGIGV